MLSIYIDFKSPESYLALAPTLALAAETGCHLQWLPFRARKRELPAASDKPERTAAHGRARQAYEIRINQHYALQQGLSLANPANPHGTDAALASLLGNEENTTVFVQAAYHAYWREGANLDCRDTVTALWTAGPNETIAIDLDALATHQLEAEQSGIVGTPAYVVAGEIFIGRAHLPLIRELLVTANP